MSDLTITPDQLAKALDGAPQGLKVLSLDCFDTLIWRNTHAPRDIFTGFGDDTAASYHRMWSEEMARDRAAIRRKREEVTLSEIYDCLLPEADAATRQAAIDAELAAEAQHAFAFAPTVALMKAARAKGLKVIIVSDIYLSHDHLTGLLRAAGGDELLSLIDRIFCSSEYGVTKATGLFPIVLEEIGVQPYEVLHVGDNHAADYAPPIALGMHALHLEQFDESTTQRLRLESMISTIIEPVGKILSPTFQPHRAQIATLPRDAAPAHRFGYTVLGPVLYGFAHWLKEQAARLRADTSGTVRFAFLLRDGHLPMRVYEAIADADGPPVCALELSRFTATAASLTTEEKILNYIDAELNITRADVIPKQLLFTKDEVARIVAEADGSKFALAEILSRPKNLKKTIERSTAFAQRLHRYVRQETGAQPGDALALIDLGYNGTVQNQIGADLAQALGVKIYGLYLLLRPQERTSQDKRGLFDLDNYDFLTLSGLVSNVSVLEQLCTVAQGSVVDYADGKPIRTKAGYKGAQSAVREAIAEAAIAYAKTYGSAFLKPPASDNMASQRRCAAAVLGRLMFLPTVEEMSVLEDFEHDVNLGTDDMLKLFDRQRAQQGLRHSGMFYIKDAKDRMYLPAEIREEGLPLSLALLTQRRFGLNLRYQDFQHKPLTLPIMVAGAGSVETTTIEAYATHDGYYKASIPIGDCRFAIGVQFGQLYDYVQVEEASFTPTSVFENTRGQAVPVPIPATAHFDGVSEAADGLYRCEHEAGFILFPPPARESDEAMMLNVVFRPIAARKSAQAAAGSKASAA